MVKFVRVVSPFYLNNEWKIHTLRRENALYKLMKKMVNENPKEWTGRYCIIPGWMHKDNQKGRSKGRRSGECRKVWS